MQHVGILIFFSLLVVVANAQGVIHVQNRFGEPVRYLYRNCENEVYFSDTTIKPEYIKLEGGNLKGTTKNNGFRIVPYGIETKILITRSRKIDTLVFKNRLIPAARIEKIATYSKSNGAQINLEIDSSFISLCPNECQYVITFKPYLRKEKSRDLLYYGSEIIITSGKNYVKLDEWIFTEKFKDCENGILYFEPTRFVRKNLAGEFSSHCSTSLFLWLKIIE